MKNLIVLFTILSFQLQAQSSIQWTQNLNIANNSFGNNHPRITLNRSNQPVVIWGKSSESAVYCSYWDGSVFSNPVKLNGTMSIATASWMGPHIASSGDTMYVVMKQIPEDQSTSHIYIVKSFDGGKNFSSPIRVENIGTNLSRFPTISVDKNGNPIVGFMKFNEQFRESRWVSTRSNDFGETFETDILASGWGGSSDVCDCCPGALMNSNDYCSMLYRDNNNNIRNIWMGISTDNANSFTNGCKVENNKWALTTCPASGPDGIIIGDTVYGVYMNGSTGRSINYLSISSLSKSSHLSTIDLSKLVTGSLIAQNFPRITNYGNAVALAWIQNVNNKVMIPLLLSSNVSNGFPTKFDTVDIDNNTNVDIAMNDKEVFVVWQDDNSRTIKFRSGIYSIISGTNKPSVTNKKEIDVFPNPFNSHLTINTEIPCTVTITNSSGNIIDYRKIKGAEQISTDQWASGVYFIKLESSGKVVIEKIIKY